MSYRGAGWRLLFMAVVVFGCVSPVWADFTFKNSTGEVIHLAVAFYGESYAGNSITGGYSIEGWYDIEPGETSTFDKKPSAYYASSDSYKWNGDGQKAFYVLPRKRFRKNNPGTEGERKAAASQGYEIRGFEQIAAGERGLTLSFGGTPIHVRNNTGKTMSFKTVYMRENNEQVEFSDWATIKSGESHRWMAPTDGAPPDFRQVINGPRRVMIGVKASNPFDKEVRSWGFDGSGSQVIGIDNPTETTTSANGKSYHHISFGVK